MQLAFADAIQRSQLESLLKRIVLTQQHSLLMRHTVFWIIRHIVRMLGETVTTTDWKLNKQECVGHSFGRE